MAYKIFICRRTASPKPKEINASQKAASKLKERLNVTRRLADKERRGWHRSVADLDHTVDDCGESHKNQSEKWGKDLEQVKWLLHTFWNEIHTRNCHVRVRNLER
jgi:hypothetical protein